jgi:ElaB/YqjD/DUF883 family membrane-anchored ribosome-binding protein
MTPEETAQLNALQAKKDGQPPQIDQAIAALVKMGQDKPGWIATHPKTAIGIGVGIGVVVGVGAVLLIQNLTE